MTRNVILCVLVATVELELLAQQSSGMHQSLCKEPLLLGYLPTNVSRRTTLFYFLTNLSHGFFVAVSY